MIDFFFDFFSAKQSYWHTFCIDKYNRLGGSDSGFLFCSLCFHYLCFVIFS